MKRRNALRVSLIHYGLDRVEFIRATQSEGAWASDIMTWLEGVSMGYRSFVKANPHTFATVGSEFACHSIANPPSSDMHFRARAHLHASQSARRQPPAGNSSRRLVDPPKKQSLSLGASHLSPRRRFWRLSMATRKYVGTDGI